MLSALSVKVNEDWVIPIFTAKSPEKVTLMTIPQWLDWRKRNFIKE